VEWIHAFCAGKLPALFPEFLDTAAVAVVFFEEVAEDPGAVWHSYDWSCESFVIGSCYVRNEGFWRSCYA
jgi:hypothetical protein